MSIKFLELSTHSTLSIYNILKQIFQLNKFMKIKGSVLNFLKTILAFSLALAHLIITNKTFCLNINSCKTGSHQKNKWKQKFSLYMRSQCSLANFRAEVQIPWNHMIFNICNIGPKCRSCLWELGLIDKWQNGEQQGMEIWWK